MDDKVNEVIAQFQEIFIDVLDEDDIVLNAETTADDIDEWDSLTHVQLIVAIEKHFKVKFTVTELEEYKNVGAMCKAVAEKTS